MGRSIFFGFLCNSRSSASTEKGGNPKKAGKIKQTGYHRIIRKGGGHTERKTIKEKTALTDFQR